MENIITTAFYTELLELFSEDNLTPKEFEWIHNHLMDVAFRDVEHAGHEIVEEMKHELYGKEIDEDVQGSSMCHRGFGPEYR